MQVLQQNITTPSSVKVEDRKTDYRPKHIFVLQLIDGRYVVGQANNACKRVAAINSGMNQAIPKSLQVARIVGVKAQEGERTFAGTVKYFIDKYGEDRVIAV